MKCKCIYCGVKVSKINKFCSKLCKETYELELKRSRLIDAKAIYKAHKSS